MISHTAFLKGVVSIERGGVKSGSLPLKYMHSPIEVLDLADIEQTAQLLAAFAEHLGKEAGSIC